MKAFALSLVALMLLLPPPGPLARGAGATTPPPSGTVRLPGLLAAARVTRDANGIPHVTADSDHDVYFMLGFLHAQDRFFEMDHLRRLVSGTLAELVGPAAIDSDIQLRTLGLRRAAEESVALYSADSQAVMQAYADGVNAWLSDPANPLPPEYTALELSRESIPAWTSLDTLTVGKGLAFNLSFDASDAFTTAALDAFKTAGASGGFDGTKLMFEDVYRFSPFDPNVSVPDFLKKSGVSKRDEAADLSRQLANASDPVAARLAKQYLDSIKKIPFFRPATDRAGSGFGSNWWIVSGSLTDTGKPMYASDPHLAHQTPALFYEAHLTVTNDPKLGPMNVTGCTVPGAPGVLLGVNDRVCWGLTVQPLDFTDFYKERVSIDLAAFRLKSSFFGKKEEPLRIIEQTYRQNQVGDGTADNLVDAGIDAGSGGITYIVPRHNNAPIVTGPDLGGFPDNVTVLSIQYVGSRGTRELEALLGWARAKNVEEFRKANAAFDMADFNVGYADVDGNIAYFTTGELPLREDLEKLGRADGAPPFLVRDGTHKAKNEWIASKKRPADQSIPYKILPESELPQVVNPAAGYVANANQDPVGTSLDNNLLNDRRKKGGLYYLITPYEGGYRMGRIVRLIDTILASGGKITMEDMKRIQSNNQMLDAEVFTPSILAAFQNAQAAGAPAALAALADDPRVAAAVERLKTWDYSTPTGLREGFDPGDDPENLSEPSEAEIRNSISATIYSLWRSRVMANTVDATLERLGLADYRPATNQTLIALRNLLDHFATAKGKGASGVNFFEVAGAPTPEAARDIVLLKSLQEALDALAGDAYADAFDHSTNQNDYRWGKLHRIVFSHPLGGLFNVPNAGGFSNVSTSLPGVAKAGGLFVVDASNHYGRAAGPNDFMFDHGPARRFVAEMAPGAVNAFEVIPGGQSGLLGDPLYANELGRWLTNRFHPLVLSTSEADAIAVSERVFEP